MFGDKGRISNCTLSVLYGVTDLINIRHLTNSGSAGDGAVCHLRSNITSQRIGMVGIPLILDECVLLVLHRCTGHLGSAVNNVVHQLAPLNDANTQLFQSGQVFCNLCVVLTVGVGMGHIEELRFGREALHDGLNISDEVGVVITRFRNEHIVDGTERHTCQKILAFVTASALTALGGEIVQMVSTVGAIVNLDVLTVSFTDLIEPTRVCLLLTAVLHHTAVVNKGVTDEQNLLAIQTSIVFTLLPNSIENNRITVNRRGLRHAGSGFDHILFIARRLTTFYIPGAMCSVRTGIIPLIVA